MNNDLEFTRERSRKNKQDGSKARVAKRACVVGRKAEGKGRRWEERQGTRGIKAGRAHAKSGSYSFWP